MPNKANQIVPPGNNETLKVMFDVMHFLWQGLAIGYMMTAMMWTQHMYSFAHLGRVSWSDTDLMNTASSGMVSGGLSWEENQINVYNSVKWFDVWELPVHTCRRRRWLRRSRPQQTPVRQSMSDICETVSEYVECERNEDNQRWKLAGHWVNLRGDSNFPTCGTGTASSCCIHPKCSHSHHYHQWQKCCSPCGSW